MYYYINNFPIELKGISLNANFVRLFAENLNLDDFLNLCHAFKHSDILTIYFDNFAIDLKYKAVKKIFFYEPSKNEI